MSHSTILPRLASSTIGDVYPRTAAAFAAMPDGEMWLERLIELDANRRRLLAPPELLLGYGPPAETRPASAGTFDVIIAGGCFGLIVGATLAARYGWRVLVFDRHQVGKTHRDWNISRGELQRLTEAGLFTDAEMETFIVAEYDRGFVKFHAEGCFLDADRLWFDDVLTLAVSSDRLLAQCRRKLLQDGRSQCLDRTTLQRVQVEEGGVTVDVVSQEDGRKRFRGRLFIDTMGTLSPIARQLNPRETVTYLCPTVGTIATGFAKGTAADEVDARVGEILVTTEHAQHGRQLLWEGFAGRDDEFTTYLFHYAPVEAIDRLSLLALFETYFETLPRYKRPGADFAFRRPVFGYIPGLHHVGLGPQKRTATHRVLLLGDAASLNSPLTFCGFGSLVRNLRRITHLIDLALKGNHLDERSLRLINAYEPGVAIMAAFTRYMVADEGEDPKAVNELLNIVMEALHRLPPSVRTGLFQDCMGWGDFVQLMLQMQKLHPNIWEAVPRKLGTVYTSAWVLNFIEFSSFALQKQLVAWTGRIGQGLREDFYNYANYYRYALV
ncbi:MAG: hypothetical protein NZ585_09495 [Chloracidobacterium sp.]|nr:hypothetical protein [Chloracidobacterium sp.]MDW8216987.1 hypothetical protein [Acidobacteriota bacterium]